MSASYDYFVVFAGMRTGSNYLERNVSSVPDVKSYGELFNPYFIAREGNEEFLGITLEMREADPDLLIRKAQADTPALAGFRLFHDHDPRVRSAAIEDPRCAKIVLTRNPVESYVSYKQALASNQWVLTDAKGQVDVPPVVFDPVEFREFAEAQAQFLTDLRAGLASAGQTALQIAYEDLADLSVINGVLRYLGSDHQLDRPERTLKRQSAADLDARVANVEAMKTAIARMDPFSLDPTVVSRLDRGAAVRSYLAGQSVPLLYLPVHRAFTDPVSAWLSAQDKGKTPLSDLSQKDLRDWRLAHRNARSLTLLCHPVRRAWEAFEYAILPTNLQAFAEVRHALVTAYKVPLPDPWPDPDLPKGKLRRAFIAFCKFLKANLAGQTGLRIDDLWVGQHTRLHGISAVAMPDIILREEELGLPQNLPAREIGADLALLRLPKVSDHLVAIYDDRVEAAVRAAYARDYAVFGFGNWSAAG
ncbi:MAG: nodulation protein NodH [Dinoroseobacter sp.]|nr:nodulation protein NodH [Dinoroseobacter sp.]